MSISLNGYSVKLLHTVDTMGFSFLALFNYVLIITFGSVTTRFRPQQTKKNAIKIATAKYTYP